MVRLAASLKSMPHCEHLVAKRPLFELLSKHLLRMNVLFKQ